jgi:hypothetical protein
MLSFAVEPKIACISRFRKFFFFVCEGGGSRGGGGRGGGGTEDDRCLPKASPL